MRYLLCGVTVLTMAACSSPEPSISNQGVGFSSYTEYQKRREAELVATEQQRRATLAVQPQTQAITPPGAPLQGTIIAGVTQPTQAPFVQTPPNNTGISDEQDFSAVSSRESIESDAQRIEENRQQYEVVQPKPLPQRASNAGPNIVQYALQATNRLGQPVYRRSSVSLSSTDRNCASYASPDLAQQDFLRRGGPERDPRNIDPDGDGFACSWDPTPFQRARGG